MPPIEILPDDLASQIAAGEVVERPASALKELLENSMDAGATRCTVAIEGGGITLLRVLDDGAGMSEEDAVMCLKRHATSKLRSFADLRMPAVGVSGTGGEGADGATEGNGVGVAGAGVGACPCWRHCAHW